MVDFRRSAAIHAAKGNIERYLEAIEKIDESDKNSKEFLAWQKKNG